MKTPGLGHVYMPKTLRARATYVAPWPWIAQGQVMMSRDRDSGLALSYMS